LVDSETNTLFIILERIVGCGVFIVEEPPHPQSSVVVLVVSI
jgi:hypothetical protein